MPEIKSVSKNLLNVCSLYLPLKETLTITLLYIFSVLKNYKISVFVHYFKDFVDYLSQDRYESGPE